MRKLTKLFVALAFALTLPTASAQTSVPADSLDSAVATFIASNFKVAMENAIADLQQTGLKVDADAVRRMVIENMSKPYDSDAHTRATAIIENAVNSISAAASDSLLRAAAAEPGAEVLPSGLVFRTITKGHGGSPTPDSTVSVRYRATLPDGTVIDEIGPDEKPLVCKASELTPGFTEALTMMQPGGSYVLTLPAALAYGEEGVPGVVPPGCAIRFDVTLLNFEH